MAGDWTPVEDLTPTKPEIIRIAAVTSRDRHEVLGRLVVFWIWAGGISSNGLLKGITLEYLASLFGPGPEFWQAVRDVGWLIETPRGLKMPRCDHWISGTAKSRLQATRRKQKQRERDAKHSGDDNNVETLQRDNVTKMSRKRCDKTATTVTEQNRTEDSDTDTGSDLKGAASEKALNLPSVVAQALLVQDVRFVAELFRRAKYAGDDGAIFWRAAALVEQRKIAEGWAVDAAGGAGACVDVRNRPGYFRRILAGHCEKGRLDLEELLRTVRMSTRHPKGPPPDEHRHGRIGDIPGAGRSDVGERPLADSLRYLGKGGAA